MPLKSIQELLKVEYDLYERFQRCCHQFHGEVVNDDDWGWDSYFLMQHHGAPTRLLDWSDGALIALHFAIRNNSKGDEEDAVVYVLEPYRLDEQLKGLSDIGNIKDRWKDHVAGDPSLKSCEDNWERVWLPDDEDGRKEIGIPTVPLVLDFPHITRRVAAQRSRFMVFGTNPTWLQEESRKGIHSSIQMIIIDSEHKKKLRLELTDSGVTESVIFPDMDGLGRELKQLWEDRK